MKVTREITENLNSEKIKAKNHKYAQKVVSMYQSFKVLIQHYTNIYKNA